MPDSAAFPLIRPRQGKVLDVAGRLGTFEHAEGLPEHSSLALKVARRAEGEPERVLNRKGAGSPRTLGP